MTKPLTEVELTNAQRALGRAVKRWKVIQGGSDHLVFEFPTPVRSFSPPEGETCRFWRFTDRLEADRFRDRKVTESVIGSLTASGVLEVDLT